VVPLDASGAAQAVSGWRTNGLSISAVAAYNDEVAFAVLSGMHQLGLSCPQDLALIGADDSPMAALSVPPLSSVSRDHAALAEHLAQTVVNRLAGKPAPRRLSNDEIHVTQRATT
jgi:DNA-binding LacI/PurR family transcriptional regulator